MQSAELRRQIFRQMCQKAQGILCGFTSIFGAYDGKDAGKAALQAFAVHCAVLHELFPAGLRAAGFAGIITVN